MAALGSRYEFFDYLFGQVRGDAYVAVVCRFCFFGYVLYFANKGQSYRYQSRALIYFSLV